MVLGHGDFISYDQLVQRITGDTLDKSNRFTDWTRRPLSPAQVSLCDLRRHAPARRLYGAGRRSRAARPHRLDGRRDGDPHLARHLPRRSGAGLDAAQDAGAQAQGAGRPDRGRGLARARSTDPRRAALTRAQGRHHRRHRHPGADHAGAARVAALAAQGLRALEMGRRHSRGREARARARSEIPASDRAAENRRRMARRLSNCSRCCCA